MIYIIRHGQTAKNKENVLQGRTDTPLNETGIRQAQEAAEWFRAQGIRLDVVYSSPLQRAVRTAEIILGGQSPQGSPDLLSAKESSDTEIPRGAQGLPDTQENRDAKELQTNAPAAPIIIDNRLIEMDYGPYEGMDLTSPPPEIVTFFSDFAHNPAPEGMEPLDDVVSRLGDFLEDIISSNCGEDCISDLTQRGTQLSGQPLSGPAPAGSVSASSVSAGSVSASCTWPGEHPNILLSTHAIAMKGALEYLTPDSHGSYWPKYIGNCEVYAFDYQDGHFSVPHRCYYRV